MEELIEVPEVLGEGHDEDEEGGDKEQEPASFDPGMRHLMLGLSDDGGRALPGASHLFILLGIVVWLVCVPEL